MAFWSAAVHDLLRHLEEVGFPAPRLVGVDGDEELLTWMEGESGPEGWGKVVPDAGLRQWASLLRRYHDAVASYRPPANSIWSSGSGTCESGEIVCHGDFGPWNGVWRNGAVVGLLDFDHARPASRLFDIAYALEYAAPFRDDGECLRWLRYPSPPNRRRRIETFCEAYGMAVPDDIVELVAEEQRLSLDTCAALAAQGIEPQASWVREVYLDTIRARVKWTQSLRL
jgi:aminoglycoside phosphotransferase (APT) family kinase protein